MAEPIRRLVVGARGRRRRARPELVALGPGDLDALSDAAHRCFPRPWSRELWAHELAGGHARVWGLRGGRGGLIAFVDFWCVREEVHVLSLGTVPAARRRGHARRLLDAVLEFAAGRGVRYVTLEVRRSNVAARALYARSGFQDLGVRPGYYDDGEDALVLLRVA